MGRLKWRFQACAISCAGHGSAGANEVNRPIEWTWPTDLAASDTLGVDDADFTHIADTNEGCDTVVEQDLALIPDEVIQRIPQAGNNELAVRVDDLGVGLRVLSLPSDTHDAIALNDNLNVTNRRTAVAVDQHAAFNDHDGEVGAPARKPRETTARKRKAPLQPERVL